MNSTRCIEALEQHTASQYCDNAVTNTKYTLLTFLPKNLFEQFSRPLNCYFLLVACLQFVRVISPVNPASTLLPLIFAFVLTALKEGYDDFLRHRVDRTFNTRCYQVLDKQSEKFESRPSENIRVGDIVRLSDGQEAPCDLVLLWCSSEDRVAYIRTDNLDGEIDLKPRIALQLETMPTKDEESFTHELCARSHNIHVECCPPDNRVYVFDSTLTVDEKKYSLNADQFIPQTCFIKKVNCLHGLVVYTGNDTKVSKSKQPPPVKWAQIDRRISIYSIFIFISQLICATAFGATGYFFERKAINEHTYLGYNLRPVEGIRNFIIPARFFLLTSVMIPISFKVIIDISKYIIAKFITWDVEMYDEVSGPATVSNTAIAEDLGQVRYILTDKTGTLTQNVMIFRACSVGGHMYGYDSVSGTITQDLLETTDFLNKVQRDSTLHNFFEHLALCHAASVMTSTDAELPETIEYRSPSPDEECFVRAAATIGCRLQNRTNTRITIAWESKMDGSASRNAVKEYEIVEEFAFTSSRKRMSIILRDARSGELRMLIKGSDDRIFPRIQQASTLMAQGHVNAFASHSLRTFVMGARNVTSQELEAYRQAKADVLLEIHNRDEKLEELQDKMEHGFDLVGASAIEDLLQEDIQNTIRSLRDGANIGFWMLTGDKYETAYQIALSCAMFGSDDAVVSLRTAESVVDAILEIHTQVASSRVVCCIIEGGPVLDTILELEKDRFIKACLLCRAIVCCRMSPKQKAIITGLVKSSGHITLSIGDGGNDVPMIQEAHIGVGIRGKEGSHASRAADFSFGKFRFLLPLLLVHGHYSYMRTSYIVQYSFYKSMLIAASQLVFNFFTLFSGISYWNSFQLSLWNGLFTVPPVVAYTLDRSLPRATLLRYPSLYRYGQNNGDMNAITFSGFLIRGIIQAILGVLITLWIAGGEHSTHLTSSSIYTGFLMLQFVTVFFESHAVTVINHIAIWGSFVLYVVLSVVYDVFPKGGSYLLLDTGLYLTLFLTVSGVFIVTFVIFLIPRIFRIILYQRRLCVSSADMGF